MLGSAPRMRGYRRAPFLSTFSDASYMRGGVEVEVDGIPVEADRLGKAQAGLGRKQQQGTIARPSRSRAIWGSKNRFDLAPRQEIHLALVMAFAWYRQDALDQGAGRAPRKSKRKKKRTYIAAPAMARLNKRGHG